MTGSLPHLVIRLAPIAAWVGASIAYRLARGKPTFFFGVHDASFQQKSASGWSNSSWFTKFGGAHNCLVVAIAGGRLIVRPWFPFTLGFLPEIYGLEFDVPVENIVDVRPRRMLLQSVLEFDVREASGQNESFSLSVRHPEQLLAVLQRAGAPVAETR